MSPTRLRVAGSRIALTGLVIVLGIGSLIVLPAPRALAVTTPTYYYFWGKG